MIFFIGLFLCISLILNFVLGYYLVKLARIIFSIEDLLSDTIRVFDETKMGIESLHELNLLFDSKEIKETIDRAMDNIKLSELALGKIIENFTNLNSGRYIFTRIENEEDEKEE